MDVSGPSLGIYSQSEYLILPTVVWGIGMGKKGGQTGIPHTRVPM